MAWFAPYFRNASTRYVSRLAGALYSMVWKYVDFVSSWYLCEIYPWQFLLRLPRYFLNDLLELIGYNDSGVKGQLNVSLTCWNLITGVTTSLLVMRFRRRSMYLTCTISLLCVYVGWTIAMERFKTTAAPVAAKLVLFFIFAYNPAYNIGYNALTYSMYSRTL